jgi:FtsZ-binding cell division protein ZapB
MFRRIKKKKMKNYWSILKIEGLNWLREVTGYFELSKELNDKLLVAHDEIEFLNKEVIELLKKNDELQQKYEESKTKIQELLRKETVDILELRSWYENRRSSQPWIYNGVRLGSQDVVKYLEVEDITPFTKLANEIIDRYSVTSDSTATEVITAMYRYWNLTSSWRYITDQVQFGKNEYWETADRALATRRGDCESKSKAMYWTGIEMLRLMNLSEHDWRLTFWATHVIGEGGHALLSWLGDDGEYYAIESTFDENNSKYKTWLRTPIRFNNLYGSPWGFATKDKSWRGYNSMLLSFRDPEVRT